MIEIDFAHAALRGHGLRLALAEVVGLVAADVDEGRGKARQQLGEHALDQRAGLGIGRVQRQAAHARGPGHVVEGLAGLDLGQMAVFGQRQDAAHVPEARQRRNQIDATRTAIGIERANLVGRERRTVAGDRGIEAKGKRVLDVKLKVVGLH